MNNSAFFLPRMAEADTPWWFNTPQQSDSLFFDSKQPFGIPNVTGAGANKFNFFDPNNTKFGWNANTLNFGMQGLMGLGNLWGAWQSNKLAKDQLNFTKDFANRNLANQTKAYNTALEDRARSRAAVEGQTSAQQQAYIDRNRLPDRG